MIRLFETIRIEHRQPQHLIWHVRRMQQTAATLGFALEPALSSVQSLENTILAEQPFPEATPRLRCRLDYSPGEFRLHISPYTIKPISAIRLIDADQLSYRHKFTDRSPLDSGYPALDTSEEVLFVRAGQLIEGRYANLVVTLNHQLFTPADYLLAGTTRARLIANGQLTVADWPLTDLIAQPGFGGIGLINAMLDFGEVHLPAGLIRQAVDRWRPESL
jgi:4-amino-4-deoxychorismate lyase